DVVAEQREGVALRCVAEQGLAAPAAAARVVVDCEPGIVDRVRGGSCVDVESQFALRTAAHLLARHPEPERSASFAGPDSIRAGGHRCSRNESFGDQASMLLERWAAGKRSHQSCAAAAQSRPLPTYQGPHWDQRILGCFRASRVRPDLFAARGTMMLR